jgi:hypothetical protein
MRTIAQTISLIPFAQPTARQQHKKDALSHVLGIQKQ